MQQESAPHAMRPLDPSDTRNLGHGTRRASSLLQAIRIQVALHRQPAPDWSPRQRSLSLVRWKRQLARKGSDRGHSAYTDRQSGAAIGIPLRAGAL